MHSGKDAANVNVKNAAGISQKKAFALRFDGLVNSIDNSDVFGKFQGVMKYL